MKFVSFWLLLLMCLITVSQGMATSASAVVIQIRGEVDPVMARYVERAIDLAVQRGARAVVIDIDTPGGRVDAALDISKAIMRTELPTVAVVTGQAWSAGALIALSARNLFMFPGSAIGAAEPIPTTEKIVAAWRSAMEGAAEANGRDPRLAAAMVDRDVEIPGVIDRGKLLSLSSQPAVEQGLADGIVVDLAQAVRDANLGQVSLSVVDVSTTEQLVRVLTGPVVSVVLLTLGLAGIIIELTTVGFGVAG
ncbi:MAG: ATP-dependent Clp protease proteolytic subunit, partial [Bacillota bacterium]|nr:ATP-dependent Clp protease proteolytic subunit [Bacillota bacterium]